MKKPLFLLGVLLLLTGYTKASSDSTVVFTQEDYLDMVRSFHPVMIQGQLVMENANLAVGAARGAFDPKWYGQYDQKSFDEKDYFSVGEAGVKLPTRTGIDFKVAYNWSEGVFLNPENSLPQNGQAIVGLELPLGQGLFIDERRAALKRAKLASEASDVERRQLQNDLIREALEAYWNWSFQFHQLSAYAEALSMAQQRFEAIRESYFLGDVPAMDTLESIIQVQNRNLEFNQATLEFRQAGAYLSVFLWSADQIPLELPETARPPDLSPPLQKLSDAEIQTYRERLEEIHPDLRLLDFKSQDLAIKERLKLEQLKPNLNLSYNFLGNGFDLVDNETTRNLSGLFAQNYKWGLSFQMPMFLRKERNGLKMVRVEMDQNFNKIRLKNQELTAKMEAYAQEVNFKIDQVNQFAQMLQNNRVLLDMEREKFSIGESSVFLINSREQKYIETHIKYIKTVVEYEKARVKLLWSAGMFSL